MGMKLSLVTLTLVLTALSGCSNWSHITEDTRGWFQKGNKLHDSRVTAYSANGDPVPVCVQAQIKPAQSLPAPFTFPVPQREDVPQDATTPKATQAR